MKIKINVKEEHIINGECGNPWSCAIALAVSDLLGEVQVTYDRIRFVRENWNLVTEMPKNQMFEFDSCGNIHPAVGKYRLQYVQPFSFEIEIPDDKLDKIFPTSHLDEVKELVNNSLNCELV